MKKLIYAWLYAFWLEHQGSAIGFGIGVLVGGLLL